MTIHSSSRSPRLQSREHVTAIINKGEKTHQASKEVADKLNEIKFVPRESYEEVFFSKEEIQLGKLGYTLYEGSFDDLLKDLRGRLKGGLMYPKLKNVLERDIPIVQRLLNDKVRRVSLRSYLENNLGYTDDSMI